MITADIAEVATTGVAGNAAMGKIVDIMMAKLRLTAKFGGALVTRGCSGADVAFCDWKAP